ncbi:MTAP family purine nucleoside phosphorylase [Candidatus Woesearchaeota archaeon]|nr:MTAP family purine nucleoside phosphorylase [Candidatus Woesearchaeota archaeon]
MVYEGNRVVLLGGSGLTETERFRGVKWLPVHTTYRVTWPEGTVTDGTVWYQESDDGVIFIPRHGTEMHGQFGPSRTQYAANLIAAKTLGADRVIATSAVGGLQEGIAPGRMVVLPSDFDDQSGRDDNLFGAGFVMHVNPRPPFSAELRKIVRECCIDLERSFDNYFGGTYVCIPGDRFGTAAEGKRRTAQGGTIVGMTLCPEASVALQLGLHYFPICVPVDMDDDAKHSNTKYVMHVMSAPERLPKLIDAVLEKVKSAELGRLEQLAGNIIAQDTSKIQNRFLRRFADELIREYCND